MAILGISVSTNLSVSHVEPDEQDEWRRVVWRRLARLDERVTGLDDSMRTFIREEVKDPRRGLVVLLVGLAFIFAGNIVAALQPPACPYASAAPRLVP